MSQAQEFTFQHPPNKEKIMNRTKPILVAAISIAMALTISCSSDDGDDSSTSSSSGTDGNSSSGTEGGDSNGDTFTESLAIKEVTNNSFTYVGSEGYDCQSNGTLEKYEYTETAAYSINNGVLAIKWDIWREAPEFNFNGNSSSLIGTWTRNKNKAAHCKEQYYRGEYEGFYCDENYDITKAVFTQNNVSITYDFCWTDEIKDGDVDWRGWTAKVIDCSNAERRKGNDVVRYNIKVSEKSGKWTLTYNGKSCERSWSEPSVSDMEKACKEAVEKGGHYYQDYYEDLLYFSEEKKLEECMKDKGFPEDLFASSGGGSDYGDDSYEGTVMLRKKNAATKRKVISRPAMMIF
jgi:hypothetical protein